MNLGELDIATGRFASRMNAISQHWLAGVDAWHSVIYCTGFTKGQREDWGLAAWRPECTCLLLSEKMRLLLVCNSELSWFVVAGERALLYLSCQSTVGLDSIQVQSRIRVHPKPAESSLSLCVISHHLCRVIRNPEFQNANTNKYIWVAFCPLFFPSLNVANATVINIAERDLLKDVNIH